MKTMLQVVCGIITGSMLLVPMAHSASSCCPGSKEAIKELKTAQVQQMLAAKQGHVVIVDARGWKPGVEIIPGSINISHETTDEQIAALIKDKNAKVITYCANTRCTASPELAKRLLKLGYTMVMEYPEGIQGWKSAGLTIEKVK